MADTTLQDLSNKLDHIAELTLIGSKTVLNIEEAALFTGVKRRTHIPTDKRKEDTAFQEAAQTVFQESRVGGVDA